MKIPVVDILRDTLACAKEKDYKTAALYRELHQNPKLELKTLYTVLKHKDVASSIIKKKRPSKLSKRGRANYKKN